MFAQHNKFNFTTRTLGSPRKRGQRNFNFTSSVLDLLLVKNWVQNSKQYISTHRKLSLYVLDSGWRNKVICPQLTIYENCQRNVDNARWSGGLSAHLTANKANRKVLVSPTRFQISLLRKRIDGKIWSFLQCGKAARTRSQLHWDDHSIPFTVSLFSHFVSLSGTQDYLDSRISAFFMLTWRYLKISFRNWFARTRLDERRNLCWPTNHACRLSGWTKRSGHRDQRLV